MEIPFIGPTYPDPAGSPHIQRAVNLYPEMDVVGGKTVAAMIGTPGLRLLRDVGLAGQPARALMPFGGGLAGVIGDKAGMITSSGIWKPVGSIGAASGPVYAASNGLHVMLVEATSGRGWILTGSALAEITDEDWPGAESVTYADGYFLISKGARVYWSQNLLDGTAWDALDYSSAEADPDAVVRLVSLYREVWVFGEATTEIFANTGDADAPWMRANGGVLEVGCAAPGSVAKLENTVYWLTRNAYGQGMIARATSLSPQYVSNRALERAIASYPRISDAEAWAYQDGGHSFYVITFPSAPGGGATWVYDVSTEMWHERSSFGLGRWRAGCHAMLGGQHVVGDCETGRLYVMSAEEGTEAGQSIRRIRTASPLVSDSRLFASRLSLRFRVGLGGILSGPESFCSLTSSRDLGRTWGSERWAGMGRVGEYEKRVEYRRIGVAQDRLFKIEFSDSVPVSLYGASADFVGKK